MRTILLATFLLLSLAAASAQDAATSVDSQPGSTSTFRVRVMTNPPASSEGEQVGSGPVVTIDEFPGIDSGGSPVISQPLESGGGTPHVLATLYGEPITEEDVVREMWVRRGRETFEWILGREILRRELRRLRLEVEEREIRESVEKHLAILRKAYPNLKKDDDLTRAASGMPLDEYRERTVWAELALRKIMNSALETRDEDLRKYFATVRADYIRPERVKVSQIFIAPEVNAEDGIATPDAWDAAERAVMEAHAMLRRRDFDEVAKTYGSGSQLARWVRRGDLLRELEEPAFSIGVGSITQPIKSSMGWHILTVEAKEERTEPALEDVRDEVRVRYEEERFIRLAGDFMARLKEKTIETGGLVLVDVPKVFADAEP